MTTEYNNRDYQELQIKLNQLANDIQSSDLNSESYKKEMQETISTLQKLYSEMLEMHRDTHRTVNSLDRDSAVQAERNTNIFYQLDRLEKRLDAIELKNSKQTDKTKQFVEKVALAVIGALITWIATKLQGG